MTGVQHSTAQSHENLKCQETDGGHMSHLDPSEIVPSSFGGDFNYRFNDYRLH